MHSSRHSSKLARRISRSARKLVCGSKQNMLAALLAAGAAAAALTPSADLIAQTRSEQTKVGVQYNFYKDWQAGIDDRMIVHAPQFLVQTPVLEQSEVELGFVWDSVSGASPQYHDTLSGASGLGIEDSRIGADIKGTTYFEQFSLGLGVSTSHEDDYISDGASIESRIWNEHKTRTLAFGLGAHFDKVESTNDPQLSEHNHNWNHHW